MLGIIGWVILLIVCIAIQKGWIKFPTKPDQHLAKYLSLSFSIDSITIKAKHMALNLPIGASVIATGKGLAADGVTEAPITGVAFSVGDATLLKQEAVDGQPNQVKLTALLDGVTVLVLSANNANGTALAPVDADITTGKGVVVAPLAVSLAISFGDITPAP